MSVLKQGRYPFVQTNARELCYEMSSYTIKVMVKQTNPPQIFTQVESNNPSSEKYIFSHEYILCRNHSPIHRSV